MKTTPTITLNMHQRTGSDTERTTSNYLLVDTNGYGKYPTLITLAQYERDVEDWEKCGILAKVVVTHPEVMWGSTDDVLSAFGEAAVSEAVKLGLCDDDARYNLVPMTT